MPSAMVSFKVASLSTLRAETEMVVLLTQLRKKSMVGNGPYGGKAGRRHYFRARVGEIAPSTTRTRSETPTQIPISTFLRLKCLPVRASTLSTPVEISAAAARRTPSRALVDADKGRIVLVRKTLPAADRDRVRGRHTHETRGTQASQRNGDVYSCLGDVGSWIDSMPAPVGPGGQGQWSSADRRHSADVHYSGNRRPQATERMCERTLSMVPVVGVSWSRPIEFARSSSVTSVYREGTKYDDVCTTNT